MTELLLYYFGAINLVTFVLALSERLVARFTRRRLPEKLMLGLCWLGGSPAAKLTQILFRYKAHAMAFTTNLHLIVLLQVTLSLAVWGAVFSSKVKPEEGSILGAVMGQVSAAEEEEDPRPKRFGPGS